MTTSLTAGGRDEHDLRGHAIEVRVDGVTVGGEKRPFDQTIVTLQPPALRFLLPENMQGLLASYPQRYLGVLCLVLKLRRSISPFYSVNICDPTPITTVVKTSHVVGTNHTDGLPLVYAPRYCDPSSPEHTDSDQAIYERYVAYVAQMFPAFSPSDVVDWNIHWAKLVEPVHELGAGSRLAPVWPGVPRFALTSNAQIYPRLLNGNSVMAFAEGVAHEAALQFELGANRVPRALGGLGVVSQSGNHPAPEVL